MLKSLIRTRLRLLLTPSFVRNGKNNKSMKIVFLALMVYAISCFFGLFGSLFSQIIEPLYEQGQGWFYFGIAGTLSFVLMFISSIFITQTHIYEAKDNELLLSMPIPPKYILASRLIMIFVLNLFWGSLVILPAEFIYCNVISFNIVQVLFFVISFLMLTLLSISVACIFGWLVTIISNKFRNKSAISTIFSLAFLMTYFYFFSGMDGYIQKVTSSGAEIAQVVKLKFLPMFFFGGAISECNFTYLCIIGTPILLLCAIIYFILSKSFISIATSKRGFKKVKYKEKGLKVNSLAVALLNKELARFTSSSVYMLNTGLGAIFTLIGAIALIINKDLINTITGDMPEMVQYINPVAIAALCFMAIASTISSPSISLEGKNIWIPKSCPIRGRDVLLSKVNLHIIICLPVTIFAAIVFGFALDMSVFMKLMLFCLPNLAVIFSALFGVIINLHFPKLDWISETVAVKQSMSTMIAMFGSFGIAILPVILYGAVLINFVQVEIYLLLVAIVFLVICLGMYRYLYTKGEERFVRDI